jgi:hypothetical protein
MARNEIGFEQKAEGMRERQSAVSVLAPALPSCAQRHYTVSEVAVLWNLSVDAVRKLFQNEPGVLVLGNQPSRTTRRYTTLRIPESVVERVHRRLSKL